jgi:hypothetical protein
VAPAPTGFHGLPAEYQTPEAQPEDWDTTLGYLDALVNCGSAIVVAVHEDALAPPKTRLRLTQQIGFLSHGRRLENAPGHRLFELNWPDREQPSGFLAIAEHLFEGASLSTVDGDDYFGLEITVGSSQILILDANTNMDHAEKERARRIREEDRDLPDADQIQARWLEWPDHEVTRLEQAKAKELREELVRQGAVLAAEKSDAELAAVWPPLWRRFTQKRTDVISDPNFGDPWVGELVIRLKVEEYELSLRAR